MAGWASNVMVIPPLGCDIALDYVSDVFFTADLMLAMLRFWHCLMDLQNIGRRVSYFLPERTLNPDADLRGD